MLSLLCSSHILCLVHLGLISHLPACTPSLCFAFACLSPFFLFTSSLVSSPQYNLSFHPVSLCCFLPSSHPLLSTLHWFSQPILLLLSFSFISLLVSNYSLLFLCPSPLLHTLSHTQWFPIDCPSSTRQIKAYFIQGGIYNDPINCRASPVCLLLTQCV